MAEIDIWCNGECEASDESAANFHDDENRKVYTDDDGNEYRCIKHHYSCVICDKIIQIG